MTDENTRLRSLTPDQGAASTTSVMAIYRQLRRIAGRSDYFRLADQNKPHLGQSHNLPLSGSDRHDFAFSYGLGIPNWGLVKETEVLAIELACAVISVAVSA
jgi:hypothetical protein